jgi:2-hydroxy-3-oxopropionate reductase
MLTRHASFRQRGWSHTSDAGNHGRRSGERAFERAKALFELMGKNHLAAWRNGDGQTTKVANQIIVSLTINAVAEALLFVSKAGADPVKGALGPSGRLCSVADPGVAWRFQRRFGPGFQHWTDRRE